MNEYITIAEFAKRHGISKQQAYQEIQKPEYADLIKTIDGIKKIAVVPIERTEQQEQIPPEGKANGIEADYIEYLKRQIAEKDKLIADKDAMIAEQNTKLSLLLEQQQNLTQQALQATQQANCITAMNTLPPAKKSLWERLFHREDKSE